MKKQLAALAFLVLGVQGVAHATFPSDGEANYNLAALSTYADRHAADGTVSAGSVFPMDAEGSFNLAALDTYADRHARGSAESWGVNKQQGSPFPSGGGYIDD